MYKTDTQKNKQRDQERPFSYDKIGRGITKLRKI